MAEAVAVVGAIAACSQLAKYGTGLAKFILNSPSELQAIPEIIDELFERLHWHLGIVRSLSTDTSDPAGQPSIEPIVRASIRAASSLQQLLTPLIVYGKQTKVKKLRRILSYQKRIRKIDRCRTDLEHCERQLILHFAATTYCNTQYSTNNKSKEVRHQSPPPSVVHLFRAPTFSTLQTSVMLPSGLFGIPPRSRLVGRDSTICSILHVLFRMGHKACLVGLGGIGKSEIAKECAYRIHDLHPSTSVFWLQASNQFVLEQSLAKLFRDSEVIEGFDTQETSLPKLIEKLDLAGSSPWLLIVDDLRGSMNRYPVMQQFRSLPIKNGSILFTTRDAYTATSLVEARSIFALDPMTVDEATEMLKSRLENDVLLDAGADTLVEYLEYHPRAIAKAAELMRAQAIPAAGYLRILQQQEQQASLSLSVHELSDVVCMESLCEHDEGAAHFLAVLACFSDTEIPLSLFNFSHGTMQSLRVLAVLRAFSLVALCEANRTVMLQRLVRRSVRVYLRRHQMTTTYNFYALRVMAHAFPEDEKQYAMLTDSRVYLPHALAVIKDYVKVTADSHEPILPVNNFRLLETNQTQLYFDPFNCCSHVAAEPTVSLDYVGPLALRVSHFLRVLGQYNRAMEIATQASTWTSGASPAEILACEASITSLLHYLGHPALFASQTEQIYLSQTVLLKSHRPLTISVLRSKGLALQAQGHHVQAEGYHRRAIAVCRSTYGPQDARLLDEEHGLALSILGQERSQEALDILCTIYNNMGIMFSQTNPKILSVLANIGCALQQLSRWTDAYHAFSCALSGRREVLGEDHPHTIQSRANLAQIHIASGDYAAAERLTRETLQIHIVKLGEDHHLSLHMMNNLGYVLLWQERFAEAAETLHRVARKREVTLGLEHCDTLDSLFYASEAYWKMKRFDDALQLGGKVLQARESFDDDDAGRRAIEHRMDEMNRDRQVVR